MHLVLIVLSVLNQTNLDTKSFAHVYIRAILFTCQFTMFTIRPPGQAYICSRSELSLAGLPDS